MSLADLQCLGEWHKIGNASYRKREIFSWPESDPDFFRSNICCACPFGGPIAVIRTEKGVKFPSLELMTSAGNFISKFTWNFSAQLIGMCWSSDYILITVFSDGTIRGFSIFPCEIKFSFNFLGKLNKNSIDGISAVSFYQLFFSSAKLACVLFSSNSNSFFACPDICSIMRGSSTCVYSLSAVPSTYENMRVSTFASVELEKGSGTSAIICFEGSGDVICLNRFSSEIIFAGNSQIISIALSFSGKLIAFLCLDGKIFIYLIPDFARPVEVCSLDASAGSSLGSSSSLVHRPGNFKWVGDDCLAIYFSLPAVDRRILFVGGIGKRNEEDDWLPLEFPCAIDIVTEPDGLRILAPGNCSLFQRVSQSTETIFGIGSVRGGRGMNDALTLCYASEQFSVLDVGAESAIRSIKEKLDEAVFACAEAALGETPFSNAVGWRAKDSAKFLLKASVFGRQFLKAPFSSSKNFVRQCSLVRICSALNSKGVDIPVSSSAIEKVGIDQIIKQLAERGLHLLALKISEWTGASAQSLFNHWGVQFMKSSTQLTDAEIHSTILKKQKISRNFSSLVHAAIFCQRPHLASMLIEDEPLIEEQVKLLLQLGSHDQAIRKAETRCDIDLLHSCSFSVQDENVLGAYCSERRWLLGALRSRFLGEWNLKGLSRFLSKIPKMAFQAAQASAVFAIYNEENGQSKSDWLASASQKYSEAAILEKETYKSPLLKFGAEMLSEAALLTKQQVLLEKKSLRNGQHSFVGKSLIDTLKKLLLLAEVTEADSLRAKFKLPDDKYWHLKIRALCEGSHFDLLANSCMQSLPCIGVEPLIKGFQSCGQGSYAVRFVPSLRVLDKQIEYYELLGRHDQADEVRLRQQEESARGAAGGIFSSLSNVLSWRRS